MKKSKINAGFLNRKSCRLSKQSSNGIEVGFELTTDSENRVQAPQNLVESTGKKGFINAFSLAEILIVLAIMGILIMLVVPNQAGVATRAKSLEAQSELNSIQTLQISHHMQYSKYSMDLTKLGYIPHKLVTAGGKANYQLSIVEATTTSFKARAEAVVDFNGDGKKNIWEIDQDGVLTEIQPD